MDFILWFIPRCTLRVVRNIFDFNYIQSYKQIVGYSTAATKVVDNDILSLPKMCMDFFLVIISNKICIYGTYVYIIYFIIQYAGYFL